MRTRARLALLCALLGVASLGCPNSDSLLAAQATDAEGNPNRDASAAVLDNYANDLDDQGKHEEALRFYDAALANYLPEQITERASCHYNRGLALRRMGRWADSVAAYETSWELDPGREILSVNISIPLEELGRHADAIVWLERGAKQFPESLAIHETLAGIRVQYEEHEAARAPAKKSLALRKAGHDQNDAKMIAYWTDYLATH